jgi:Uma2 family endonuclease
VAIALHSLFSFPEYIAFERLSASKHEFVDGAVLAMAGGSPEQAAIAARLARLIGNAVEGRPCNVYSSDLRVRVPATGLTTYPDVTVICGKLQADPEDANTATNPLLLVEVLSESTAAYDRGEKLAHYQRLASLQEVLFVAHDSRQLELWQRQPDGAWALHVARGSQVVQLGSVPVALGVASVYDSAF